MSYFANAHKVLQKKSRQSLWASLGSPFDKKFLKVDSVIVYVL